MSVVHGLSIKEMVDENGNKQEGDRGKSGRSADPVLHLQPGNAEKFSFIVRHENHAARFGMGCNP